MDLLVAVQLMGAASVLGTLYILRQYAVRYALPVSSLWLGSLIYALSAPVAIWGVGGLEVPLVMLLLLCALVLSRTLLDNYDTATAVKTGYLLGLICLLRPEGPVYTIALTAGLMLVSTHDIRKRLRLSGTISLIAFAFFAALLAWRLCYFGTWVPNTVLVKVTFGVTRVVMGLVYSARAYLSFIAVLWFTGHYLTKKGHSTLDSATRAYVRFLLIVSAILSVAIILSGGDWMLGYRAYVPLIPVCILVFMESCRLVDFYKKEWCFIAAVFMVHMMTQLIDKDNLNAKLGQNWVPDVLQPMGEELKRLYGDKQPLIAVFTAGAIPYYSGFPTLDVYGLNDSYLTSHRYENKEFGHGLVGHDLFDEKYIERRKPDLLVFETPGIRDGCKFRKEKCDWLFTNYEPFVIAIPKYDVTAWRRKDSEKLKN